MTDGNRLSRQSALNQSHDNKTEPFASNIIEDRETPLSDVSGTPMSVAYEVGTVSEDATLDDFFGDGDGESDRAERKRSPPGSDGDEGQDDGRGDDDGVDTGPNMGRVDRFDATVQWTPPGTTCSDCGATVQRRWADDQRDEEALTAGEEENEGESRFVCRNCKDW